MATSTLGSGTLVLAGTTSGTTTVTATAVAGTTTLTLPAATDTLVGKATTDTLTNKTLGAVTLGGTIAGGGNQINNVIIGTTSPLAGSFTTLSTSGKVGIGAGVQSTIQFYVGAGGTDLIFDFGGTGGDVMYSGAANAGITAGENAAASILFLRKNTATSRSINAAGTINQSGADYAEYMTKSGDFTVAKGDVIGINSNGKLTNIFADAISFCVKSTDPGLVGGDVWGSEEAIGLSMPEKPAQRQATEEVEAETDEEFAVRQTQYEDDKTTFNAALEVARQRVDRIAFAGQVPINVTGATAGQYIIPVNDNGAIKGEAVSNPTFEQYQIAVGKVIAIESDGRAKIIVKMA